MDKLQQVIRDLENRQFNPTMINDVILYLNNYETLIKTLKDEKKYIELFVDLKEKTPSIMYTQLQYINFLLDKVNAN